MENKDKLECPFCGKSKLKVEVKLASTSSRYREKHNLRYTASVRCNCCHARGPTVYMQVEAKSIDTHDYMTELAVTAWNTRPI